MVRPCGPEPAHLGTLPSVEVPLPVWNHVWGGVSYPSGDTGVNQA